MGYIKNTKEMRLNMKKNLIIATLLLGILMNGWTIAFLKLPFYQAVLLIGGLSIVIMSIIHERLVFLYAITVTLSFGAFLTIHAFAFQRASEIQLLYIYNHLLLTSFLLMYWVLMNLIKKIGYEYTELKQQVQLLQKYTGITKLLTMTEFNEQAQWLLKSSERNKEEAWFVKIVITHSAKRTKENLQEELERLALLTIRQKFDLITRDKEVIYLLLKNTHAEGAERVLERLSKKVQEALNFIEPPFTSIKEQVIDENHLHDLIGENS